MQAATREEEGEKRVKRSMIIIHFIYRHGSCLAYVILNVNFFLFVCFVFLCIPRKAPFWSKFLARWLDVGSMLQISEMKQTQIERRVLLSRKVI